MEAGATGRLSFDRDLSTEAATLEAMTETMACRGPDDRGVWAEGPACLGHRWLAIIDLSGGRRPMTAVTPHGTVALVHSGEACDLTRLTLGSVAAPAHSESRSEPQELPSGGRVPYSRNASTLRCTHLDEP